MKYTVDGTITLSPQSKRRLGTDVHFVSPSQMDIVLSSKSDNEIAASIKLEANDDFSAKEIARLELSRICNILSFRCGIGISGSRIGGMSCVSTKKGSIDLGVSVILGLKADVDAVVAFHGKSLSRLVSYLQQDYPDDFEESIFSWREAISSESPALQYWLLYRLLEFLFQSDTRKLTSWLIEKDPNVQLVEDRNRRKITIYTSLRDHIHRKEKVFPFKEIQEKVGKLQALVQQRIKEKYNIQ